VDVRLDQGRRDQPAAQVDASVAVVPASAATIAP
jgi:hypothetical protein